MQTVLDWYNKHQVSELYISALTIGELNYGIALLPDNQVRDEIYHWLEEITGCFSDRIVPINDGITIIWGKLRAELQKQGKTLPVIDGLLAATCQYHNLTLVTRNSKDFEATGIKIINPW